jgi:hypothetical protein
MPQGQIHRNDVGTLFLFTFTDDGAEMGLDAMNTVQVTFTKPGGATFTRNLELVNGGIEGIAGYNTVEGDLDTAGRWSVQGYVADANGSWHTDIAQFVVYP